MLGLYIGIGILFSVLLLSLFYFRVNVSVDFYTSPGNTVLTVKAISRFYQMQKRIPLRDLTSIWDKHQKNQEDQNKDKAKLWLGDYLRLGNFAIKHLVVEKLDWKSYIGVGDAMITALSTGSLWAVKGMLTGFLSSRARLLELSLIVEPDFNNEKLVSHINCILKMRIVHIILIALFFRVLIVRGYINGWTTGKTNSSYRRFNENRYASY